VVCKTGGYLQQKGKATLAKQVSEEQLQK